MNIEKRNESKWGVANRQTDKKWHIALGYKGEAKANRTCATHSKLHAQVIIDNWLND